jgi:hypothetical protein
MPPATVAAGRTYGCGNLTCRLASPWNSPMCNLPRVVQICEGCELCCAAASLPLREGKGDVTAAAKSPYACHQQ